MSAFGSIGYVGSICMDLDMLGVLSINRMENTIIL